MYIVLSRSLNPLVAYPSLSADNMLHNPGPRAAPFVMSVKFLSQRAVHGFSADDNVQGNLSMFYVCPHHKILKSFPNIFLSSVDLGFGKIELCFPKVVSYLV